MLSPRFKELSGTSPAGAVGPVRPGCWRLQSVRLEPALEAFRKAAAGWSRHARPRAGRDERQSGALRTQRGAGRRLLAPRPRPGQSLPAACTAGRPLGGRCPAWGSASAPALSTRGRLSSFAQRKVGEAAPGLAMALAPAGREVGAKGRPPRPELGAKGRGRGRAPALSVALPRRSCPAAAASWGRRKRGQAAAELPAFAAEPASPVLLSAPGRHGVHLL